MRSFSVPAFRLPFAALALCLGAAGLRAADTPPPDGWFVWPATEPVADSALDVSALNALRGAALPRIAVKGAHFVTPDGRPVRFWGTNVSGAEAFPPTADDATTFARRLAKGGVNIARLHHLDNPWGVGTGGSLWPADRQEHNEFDPTQLDRLHRFIAALRDQGIYTNLNLKVSKALVPADGFADSVTTFPHFQKRVDIYNRKMIELQKDYARRLLTTKNPYTGLAPFEDPAIAVIEINNENSLLGYWTRDLGRGLDRFPEPFREELRLMWNDWLGRRYGDDTRLAQAWAPPANAPTDSLLPADAAWQPSIRPGSTATVTGPDATTQEINVTATAGIDWHVQVALRGLALDDGQVYSVEFLAKSDRPRALGVGVGLDGAALPHEPWRSFGLQQSVDLKPEWTRFRLAFPAHSVAGAPAALSLNAGQTTGLISLKEIKLVRGAFGAGLQPGQAVRAKTVAIPTAPTARQWADWITFLAETERAYAEDMRDYLKQNLRVQAPIVCSQIDYGGLTGLNREAPMDFADAHAYWQHPDFPAGADWDASRWSIRNSPQLADFQDRAFGELGNLAFVRVATKPFTVSEYDHPAPSEFVAEMYPELAAFASRQDWDIVYSFCMGANGRQNPTGKITDFFDQLQHPAKWSQSPFAARTFRLGLVPPASAVAELRLGNPFWAQQPHAEVLWRQLVPTDSFDFLNIRYGLHPRAAANGVKASLTRSGTAATASSPVRLVAAPQGQVLVIDAPQSAAAVGYLGGATVEAGALQVTTARFGRDFASVTAIALDDRPLRESTRVLVTVVARATNQDIVWNEARNSLGKNWGTGPTLAERVPATITLASAGREVFALAPDGSRTHPVAAEVKDGSLTFSVGPADTTLHYEIVAP